jgi:hypothetical protein
VKTKFIKLQSLLNSETKSEVTVNYLRELVRFLKETDMGDEKMMKGEVYDELRDTVKSIFSYLEKVKVPASELLVRIEQGIRALLIGICHFCSAYYCLYHPLGCGDMIKEFLSSECRLFVPAFEAAAPSVEAREEAVDVAVEEREWQWTKESSFKTVFFCDCIEVIMRNLCAFEKKLEQMRVTVIGQFLRLLYYMDDYIMQDKIVDLCIRYVDSLEVLFRAPSKEIMKDAAKDKLEEVSEYLTKLLRYYKNDSLKKRIQLLGPQLGMTMLKMNSIEKKIVGCKVVSKFSYEMLYRSTSYITETSYSEWIIGENFFDLVFEDHCQTSLIKSSEDTFKLLVKRGQLKKEQFQKFFEILEKAEPDLRRAMFRLIDPFRVDYYQIEAMLEIFGSIRSTEFYDDEFFYFMEGLSRYSTEKQLTVMLGVVEAILREHYNKFESYLTKRRAVECYAYVFDRLVTYKDLGDRIEAYAKVAQEFIEEPSQNRIIMLRTLFENLSDHKMERNSQEVLCDRILISLKFIENSLKHAAELKYRDDLVSTIKIILRKYSSSFNRQPFSQETLLECVNFPEIFEEMLKLTASSEDSQLLALFDELASLSAVKDFEFPCMRSVFIKLNSKSLRPIKKEYTDVVGTYVTCRSPEEFEGLETLKYLIFNSKRDSVREGACQLLVDIYTNLADDFREEGELYLVEFMKTVIQLVDYRFGEFFEGRELAMAVLGTLQLMQELMLNTEYFGVGSLKAHNSLIPTSTVVLKVFNNCTYGDDVLKIFEKKIPSNKTLFEVIVDVSKQFKIGPLDMCFEYPNSAAIRHNGLTLEELKLNRQEVNAIKLPQSRLKKVPLVVDGVLTPQARQVFIDMFHKYAPSGKMAPKECAQYIEGVTLSFCPLFDSRISSLYAEYDTDKDGILLVDDFLKFYEDCMLDVEKMETVDKNLANLRYRRDLKLYDAELDSLDEQVLFRYHIWQHKGIYAHLFRLTTHEYPQISALAQLLLLRLPTYPKVVESLTEAFNLRDKSPFEVEYLLTALQSQIASEDEFSKQLIASSNHLAIFEYLKELSLKEQKSPNEKHCQIICLHLLHTLLFSGIKKPDNLLVREFPALTFSLPQTDVFMGLIRESVKAGDPTLLEPSFSLQLTQEEMPLEWVEEAAFNRDKDIRTTTCGFLYMWMLKNRRDLNLFELPISDTHNEEWFSLLTLLIQAGIQVDCAQIFQAKTKELASLSESLESNRFNPIIQGNLMIIREIHPKLG